MVSKSKREVTIRSKKDAKKQVKIVLGSRQWTR